MASNFHLFQIPNGDSLHIYMRGDFDGTSAHELINALKNQKKDYFKVINALIALKSFWDKFE